MFKFGDYTLQEVAEKWDCSEEGVLAAFQNQRGCVRRQFWLFGPLLYSQAIVDDMAPDVRAMMQRMGATRADMAHRRQDLAELKAQNEQAEQRLAEMRQRFYQQQTDFSQQMMEMLHHHFSPPTDDEQKQSKGQ